MHQSRQQSIEIIFKNKTHFSFTQCFVKRWPQSIASYIVLYYFGFIFFLRLVCTHSHTKVFEHKSFRRFFRDFILHHHLLMFKIILNETLNLEIAGHVNFQNHLSYAQKKPNCNLNNKLLLHVVQIIEDATWNEMVCKESKDVVASLLRVGPDDFRARACSIRCFSRSTTPLA